MNLDVYTPSFEYLGCIDSFSSLRWRRQCFDAGEFELHCPADENNIYLIQKDCFILRQGYEEFAVLEGRRVESTEDGDMITATGRLGTALLSRAVINGSYHLTGPVEASMRKLVSEQLPRVYSAVELGALQGFSEALTAQVSYQNLLEALLALSKASNILFRLRPDAVRKKVVFECFKGIDRSVGQSMVPYVAFSDRDDTLTSATYEENVKAYRNFAYVGGEGEGASRKFITVNRVSPGAARREIFVDAKDIKQEDLTDGEYSSLLAAKGAEKLDETLATECFESDMQVGSSYRYREDWELGDIATCDKSSWGIMTNTRITEVEEVFESSTGADGQINPVFGSPLPEKFNLGG